MWPTSMEPLAVSTLRYAANPAALPVAESTMAKNRGSVAAHAQASQRLKSAYAVKRAVRHVGPVDAARVGGEGSEQRAAVRLLAQRLDLTELALQEGAAGSRRRLPTAQFDPDRLAELVGPHRGAGNTRICLDRPAVSYDAASLEVSFRLHAEIYGGR